MSVPGWPTAFRGSYAVAAGLVTPDRLRGPRFLRLLPDVYCRAAAEPPGLLLRSLAAYRLVEGRGVLSGHSAAALLDAECAPRRGTPAEVTLLHGNLRAHPGLVVRRGLLRHDEITHVRDVACTTPLRTAFDLARGADRMRPSWQSTGWPTATASTRTAFWSSTRATGAAAASPGSPQWSRCPARTPSRRWRPGSGCWSSRPGCPVRRCSGWCRTSPRARRSGLDLAWPERRIGIEYEGEPHTEPGRVLRDIARHTRLVDLGWQVYRYTKREVYGDRARIVAELVRARARCTPAGFPAR